VCLEVCPREVLELRDNAATIVNIDRCIECGACELNCRFGAVSVQSGVGCAAALINSLKTGGEPSCGCGGGESDGGCCG
jgi:Fe-S-cluster-containing hydrogenase component 2